MDRLVHLCIRSEVSRSQERVPHRLLEHQWLDRLLNETELPGAEQRTLAKLSALGQPLNVFSASRDDIYAYTHAMMYFTDLGERRVRLPRQKVSTLADAEAAVACCLDQQDYDLCGEILLSWPYLSTPWNATAVFAFRVLTSVEDKVGFLPSPLTRLARFNSLSGVEAEQYAMATVYHTAYVMGLLCAGALKNGQTPPYTVPTALESFSEAALAHLIRLLDASSASPHWRDCFSGLDQVSQCALAPMLMTIALKRAVTSRDLVLVRDLLTFGLENGIVDYPATRQAAGLLKRLAQASDVNSSV